MEDNLLFDLNKATEIIGSRKESLKLISILMSEIEEIKLKIISFAKLEDQRQLRDLVHSTIGMAAYCGTPLLSMQLINLQNELKNHENTTEESIQTLTTQVVTTINKMLKVSIDNL